MVNVLARYSPDHAEVLNLIAGVGEFKKPAAIDEQRRQVAILFETASPFDLPLPMTGMVAWFNYARTDE